MDKSVDMLSQIIKYDYQLFPDIMKIKCYLCTA